MSKAKSILKIFGPGVISGIALGLYAYTAVANTSISYSIRISVIGGVLGTIIGLIYWLGTRNDGGKATSEHKRYVSKNSFNITQDGDFLLLDYKGLTKTKAKWLPAIVTILMIGGCVPTLQNDALGFYLLYCAALLAFLYFGLKPTFATVKIKPDEFIEGEEGRIGFEYISEISYNIHNEVFAVTKGAEFAITSRLSTHRLAMEISSELNSLLTKYKYRKKQ